jgi:broad specificity phosphatase PhoE
VLGELGSSSLAAGTSETARRVAWANARSCALTTGERPIVTLLQETTRSSPRSRPRTGLRVAEPLSRACRRSLSSAEVEQLVDRAVDVAGEAVRVRQRLPVGVQAHASLALDRGHPVESAWDSASGTTGYPCVSSQPKRLTSHARLPLPPGFERASSADWNTLRGVRRRPLLALALAAVAAVGGCDFGSDDDEPRRERPRATRAPSGDAFASVVDELRRGGSVLVFRHAATDFSMVDRTRDLRDCARQRNLNAEGRRQSRTIGSALKRLGIPVGEVLASPYCRTVDTARLAFGRFRSSTALLSAEALTSRSARERQPARLRRLLAAPPRRGTNTVLVSHGFAIDDAAGLSLAEGEVAVVTPSGRPGDLEVVATVEAD